MQHNVSSATTPRINIPRISVLKGEMQRGRKEKGCEYTIAFSPRRRTKSGSQASQLRQPYPIVNENYLAIPATEVADLSSD